MAKFPREEELQIIQQINAATKRGDKEESRRLAKLLPLAPHLAKSLKEQFGPDNLRKEQYDLSEAEAAYGKNWLNQ